MTIHSKINTFTEYWAAYRAAHHHPICRGFHLAGTAVAVAV
jgi:hypothetical protein